MRGGADTIIAYGTDQTIESGLCSANAIYLLGRHTNLEFYESVSGTTMVHGGQTDGASQTVIALSADVADAGLLGAVVGERRQADPGGTVAPGVATQRPERAQQQRRDGGIASVDASDQGLEAAQASAGNDAHLGQHTAGGVYHLCPLHPMASLAQ